MHIYTHIYIYIYTYIFLLPNKERGTSLPCNQCHSQPYTYIYIYIYRCWLTASVVCVINVIHHQHTHIYMQIYIYVSWLIMSAACVFFIFKVMHTQAATHQIFFIPHHTHIANHIQHSISDFYHFLRVSRHNFLRHDSFIHVTWLIHTHPIKHSIPNSYRFLRVRHHNILRHDESIYVTGLIHACNMTHSYTSLRALRSWLLWGGYSQ